MKKKFPLVIFIFGFFSNLLGRFFILTALGILLSVIGIWISTCLYLGLTLLSAAIILSLIEEIRIIRTLYQESDNSTFTEFQNAALSDDWRKNVMDLVEKRIQESDQGEEPDTDVETPNNSDKGEKQ